MEFTVVYPAFNEEHSLRKTVLRSLDALRPLFRSFEILIVNDGSRDQTGAIADGLEKEFPSEVRVLHNPANVGQGASIVNGMKAARGDLLLHNGVDYPFDLLDLPRLMAKLDHADIVVASRTSRPGYSAYRKLTSFVNLTLIHLLFDVHLKDYNFVQLFRREVWQKVPVEFQSSAFLTPGLLIRAHDMGYRIAEVQIDYHAREAGVATTGNPRIVIASMREMFSFWWRRQFGKPQVSDTPAARVGGAGK